MSKLDSMSEVEYRRFANPESGRNTYAREEKRIASKGVKGYHKLAIRVIPRSGTVTFTGRPRRAKDISVTAEKLAKVLKP